MQCCKRFGTANLCGSQTKTPPLKRFSGGVGLGKQDQVGFLGLELGLVNLVRCRLLDQYEVSVRAAFCAALQR